MDNKQAIQILTTKHYEALTTLQKLLKNNQNALLGFQLFIKENNLQEKYDEWIKNKNKGKEKCE